jgi:ribonuclease HI
VPSTGSTSHPHGPGPNGGSPTGPHHSPPHNPGDRKRTRSDTPSPPHPPDNDTRSRSTRLHASPPPASSNTHPSIAHSSTNPCGSGPSGDSGTPTRDIRRANPRSEYPPPPSTPPFFRHKNGTQRYRGFCDLPWTEDEPLIWRTRMCKLRRANRVQLLWVLNEHPEFHRLCFLHGASRHTPTAERLIALVTAADNMYRDADAPTIFARVNDLQIPKPAPILGLDFDLVSPPTPPLSSLEYPAAAVPTPSNRQSSFPSPSPAAAPAGGSFPPAAPRVFCRSNDSRLPKFGKDSTGLYRTAYSWKIVLQTVSRGSHTDLTWLLHYQWPSLHALCLQHAGNPEASLVTSTLFRAEGGPDFFRRVCAIPPLPASCHNTSHTAPTTSVTNPPDGPVTTPPDGPAAVAAAPTPGDCRPLLPSPAALHVRGPSRSAAPRVFCRSDGSRRPQFGRQSTGLYETVTAWNSVLPTLSRGTIADWTWLLHHQWPSLHSLCLQHADNPAASAVTRALVRAKGGLDFFHRVCAIQPPRALRHTAGYTASSIAVATPSSVSPNGSGHDASQDDEPSPLPPASSEDSSNGPPTTPVLTDRPPTCNTSATNRSTSRSQTGDQSPCPPRRNDQSRPAPPAPTMHQPPTTVPPVASAQHTPDDNHTARGGCPSIPRRVCHRPTPTSSIVPPPPELAASPPLPDIPAWATHNEFILWFDGGTQENNQSAGRGLRPSGAGFALFKLNVDADGTRSLERGYLGGVWLGDFPSNTNNIAEYNALLWGLRCAWESGARQITVVGDSQLVIRQLDGSYQARDPALQRLHRHALHLMSLFESVRALWVSRAENSLADRLANLAIFHRSSLVWGAQWDWATAIERWSKLRDLAPHLYAVSCPEQGPSLVPLYHSPAQVIDHLEGLFRTSSCISSTEFRDKLVETFSHASLRAEDLLHDRALFRWARNACQSRETRSTVSHAALRVQLSATDGGFESFWCSVVVLSRPQKLSPLLSQSRHGGPPFGNLSWHNPLTTSRTATPGNGHGPCSPGNASTTGGSSSIAPRNAHRPAAAVATSPHDQVRPPSPRNSTPTSGARPTASTALRHPPQHDSHPTSSNPSAGDMASSLSGPGAHRTRVPARPREVPGHEQHDSDETYELAYHWDQSRPPISSNQRTALMTARPRGPALSSVVVVPPPRATNRMEPTPARPCSRPGASPPSGSNRRPTSTTSLPRRPAQSSVVVVPPPSANTRMGSLPDRNNSPPSTTPPNSSHRRTSTSPATASSSRPRHRSSRRRSRMSPPSRTRPRPGPRPGSGTQESLPYSDCNGCPRDARSRSHHHHADAASHLVTVKWIDPSLPEQHVLSHLRDTGLFIPAGTRVYQGHGDVRVLGFSSAEEVRRLLSSKGAILRRFPHLSLNRGQDTPWRRMPYCERRAIQAVHRNTGPGGPCHRQ